MWGDLKKSYFTKLQLKHVSTFKLSKMKLLFQCAITLIPGLEEEDVG